MQSPQNYMNDAPVTVGIQANPSNSTAFTKDVALTVLGLVSLLDNNWSPHFTSQSTTRY
jgi:hypothetical protein